MMVEIIEDNVNNPKHYANHCSIECIDAMIIAFGVEDTMKYCIINAFKYVWRCEAKNKIEDLNKAKWYIDKFLKLYSEWEDFKDDMETYNERALYVLDNAIPKLEEKLEKECTK